MGSTRRARLRLGRRRSLGKPTSGRRPAGIGFAITATDETAAAIAKVQARVEAFGKRTQANMERATVPYRNFKKLIGTIGDVGGITRVTGAIGGMARAGNNAYQKVGQVIPLLGIIGSAATVAGVVRMTTAWADWGAKVGFTAQRIGISTDKLTGFQGAARLAGASADGMASGLQTLGQTMYDAVGGRAPEAVVMFRTLGIAFQDATGHARSVADVLPEVADKIKSIRDPFAQAQVATTLFGGAAEELLPFLRKGSAGIREYVDTARRYGVTSDASAAAANRLREAQARVSLATEGLRNRIAERLEPVLTPLLTHFANWVATSPQVAYGVEWLGTKVEELGRWIDGGGIQRFGDTLHSWLDPIGKVVTALGGPETVIKGLIALMVGSFALKVIAPFWMLGSAIAAATAKTTVLMAQTARLSAMQAAGAGGKAGLLGKVGGLAGGLGMAAMGWEGADLLGGATEPSGNGIGNLLHNMVFEANPLHWTRGFHPGQAAAASGAPRGAGGSIPSGPPANPAQWAADLGQLQSLGWSRDRAAGILGNLQQESGGDHKRTGDGGAAFGLGQWHAKRQSDFEYVNGHSIRDSTHAEQIAFVDWELRHTEKAAGQRLSQANGARESAAAVRQHYERPDQRNAVREDQVRSDNAEQMMRLPLAAPTAQGAPMQLAGGGQSGGPSDSNGKSTVRVEFGGKLPDGMNMQVANPQKVDVGGPLVERPMLLGANP